MRKIMRRLAAQGCGICQGRGYVIANGKRIDCPCS